MTLDECVQLFRSKHTNFTAGKFLHLSHKHNIPRKHKHVGWGKRDALWQEYAASGVLAVFQTYKPKQRFTYTTDTPPPDGWLTLRQIADYLGANFQRIQKMCSSLTIPARLYKGRRYAPLALFEDHLPWRPASFVRKHRSKSWISKRIAWQKEKNLKQPLSVKAAWQRFVFAPELIHL